MNRKISALALILSLTVLGVNAKQASSKLLASDNFYGTTVAFHAKMPVSSSEITIVGPNEFHAQTENKRGMVSVQLLDYGKVADGKYNYRMVVKSGPSVRLKEKMNNGRDPNKEYYGVKGRVQTGHFYVKYGSIQSFRQFKEPQR